MKIKDVIVGCLVIAILSSCATQKRCFDKYGNLEPITIRDTIYVPKEVVKFSFRTLIDTLEVVDTFMIEKDRVRAIFTRDTIIIECKSDTIYTETIIEIPVIQDEKPKFWKMWEWWGLLGLLVLVIYISKR